MNELDPAEQRLRYLKLSLLSFLFTVGTAPFIATSVQKWAWNNAGLRAFFYRLEELCGDKFVIYDVDIFFVHRAANMLAISLPACLSLLSAALLMRSLPQGWARWKLLLLPSLFFGVLGAGVILQDDTVLFAGVLCLAAAPNWLGEILRVRASSLGLYRVSACFFAHHILAIVVAFNLDYKFLVWIWWLSYLAALFCFWSALQFSHWEDEADVSQS